MINQFYIDYIKAIENPDRVGWNGKVWIAPQHKGYDKNQRGYGIDIIKNDSAKRLTQNRPGQWLTEGEANKLMKEHLLYVYNAAQKHIEGFDNLSDKRKAALLGMLYRGDSVNKNKHIININEPDDNKFFESISNYYKSKGLNERAKNSSNFFSNNQLTNFLIPMKWEQWEPPMKFKSGGQIRKMQTAAGGPLRIKFTPEQIAYFESQATRVPGTNNSGGNKYREKGVLALQHLEQEAKRKEEEIKSRMEMRPTLKRKAEKLGDKDEYELKPQIVGMSGTDPVGEFILAGIGLNGIGALAKTGLWNVAKYAPTTQLGNYGRLYFVGNAFKNSFNEAVPTLTSQATSLLYLPAKLNESKLTSLKFFERKPSRINEAERAGIPKGERNVKQGYLLKDAIEEANKFAEKWGYDKLSQNATLLDIEDLYNQHNTFFRGVTTEQLENTRNRIAKELGINPELLTNDLYLLYVSTHPWPGNDRIWVTPFSHYGKMYGNPDMFGGKGLLSAVMRPWKTTKDIKQWPKLSLWTLGFKEDTSNPVITPWASNAPDAIRSLGALSEFLVKPPLIYRGLGKDFKGTFLLYLKYKDNQGKLGWIESLIGELPLEIIIEKQGGKMNIIEFLKNGSGIHIKEKNKGKFTKSAKAAGLSVQEHAKSVLNDPNATPLLKKRANFARNAAKWKHLKGGTINGGSLEEVTVVPTRLSLSTYYPIIGRNYRYTGHSSLRANSPEYTIDTSEGFKTISANSASINKKSSDAGYNFITNNCADATRCALEAITGKKMNPYFFTTPGDVLDFFKENFDDVRKIKSKNSGKEVYYTNITPKQLEIIKEQLLEQMLKNREEQHKELLLKILKNREERHKKLLANAKYFKHKEGGIIKAQEGTNLFEANKEIIPLSLQKKFFKQVYQDELNKNKLISAITGNVINTSPIVAEHEAFKLASLEAAGLNEQTRRNKKMSEAQKLAQQSADISGLIGDGLGIIADYFINKKSNKTSSGTSSTGTSSGTSNYKVDSFWTTPSLSGGNQFKVDYTNLFFK